MHHAEFVQVAVTALALAALMALAAWLKLAKPPPPLDDARARAMLEAAFPGRPLEAVWVGQAGKGALAKSGAAALVLCQVGEGFTARQMPWAQVLATAFKTGRLAVDLTDVDAPSVVISLALNPPERIRKDLAA
jgi:hypothetical protein